MIYNINVTSVQYARSSKYHLRTERKMRKKGRKDGRVEIKVMRPDGTQKSVYGYTVAEAKLKAEEFKMQIRGAEAGANSLQKITFNDWAPQWAEAYAKPQIKPASYVSRYDKPLRLYILPCFGDKEMHKVTPIQVQEWANALSLSYSKSTVKAAVMCLKRMYEDAIENRHSFSNPARKTTIAAKNKTSGKRFYSGNTRTDILEFANTHPWGYVMYLLLECGLRRSEICGLQWGDIDFRNYILKINRARTASPGGPVLGEPKSASSKRRISISQELAQVLAKQKKQTKFSKANDFVLGTREGKPFATHHFTAEKLRQKFYKDYIKERGLQEFPVLAPHEHRHTCGTLLYRQTRDVYQVMRFLGHSSVEVTASIYVHADDDEKEVDLERYLPKKLQRANSTSKNA